ncbi:sensor histidine kinase [Pontibacter harenae]|uniref:sensor histidine kinase n=1 Tax=Pontibacter harenae TaxID=2894083 RepID=UPI001E4A45DD|nr:7TM diverse intracellular signaling domain-containing protein [Pontibacter harenae]MCC9168687.1 histidine kinase [Pontibacter harenae]
MAQSFDLEFVFKCFFQGVLFAQLVYVVLHLYAHNRRRDYFYYLLFLVSSIAYFLYKDIMYYGMGWRYGGYPFPHEGINYIMANLMHLAYLKFVKHFIGTRNSYPRIHWLATNLKRFIFGFIMLNALSLVFFKSLVPVYAQYVYSGLVAAATAVLICQMLRRRSRLVSYIIFGSVMYSLGALLSLVAAVLHLNGFLPGFSSSLTITQVGTMLEVLCFTAGLAYKSLLVEKEGNRAKLRLLRQMKQNLELSDSLQQVRNKISEDLHDDVGGTLTAISVYSDVAHKYQQLGNVEGVSDMLRQIGGTARQMINDMQDIIWMVNPKNDGAYSLYDRIHSFAEAVATGKGIVLHFSVLEGLKDMQLDMQLRRDVYLMVKESINNAVKHASCRNLWISFDCAGGEMRIVTRDDGTGFQRMQAHRGNGLPNLEKRMQAHRGVFSLESGAEGTVLTFIFGLGQTPA